MRRECECDNDNNDAHKFHFQWCVINCLIQKASYQNSHAMTVGFEFETVSPHAHTVTRLMILS